MWALFKYFSGKLGAHHANMHVLVISVYTVRAWDSQVAFKLETVQS